MNYYKLIQKFSAILKRNVEQEKMIRIDSVEDFISHVNQANISLSTQVNLSIFETNSFLVEKHPTLIEYASFFGSIQIFQYLKMNDVKLTSSLISIGTSAFRGCSSLMEVLIPSSVTQIRANSFEQCSSLSHVSILNSIQLIELCLFKTNKTIR